MYVQNQDEHEEQTEMSTPDKINVLKKVETEMYVHRQNAS